MWGLQIVLAVIGLSAGITVAGGLFSFISGLGVISDFADRTHTGEHILLYEDATALGGILGNIFIIYQIEIPCAEILLPVFGILAGDFCGLLGYGVGRDAECLSYFCKKGKADQMYSVGNTGNGTWKRHRSISFLFSPLVVSVRQ